MGELRFSTHNDLPTLGLSLLCGAFFPRCQIAVRAARQAGDRRRQLQGIFRTRRKACLRENIWVNVGVLIFELGLNSSEDSCHQILPRMCAFVEY